VNKTIPDEGKTMPDKKIAVEVEGNIATALREIEAGKGKEFATVEELIADLDS
jgi:hypothetical protein